VRGQGASGSAIEVQTDSQTTAPVDDSVMDLTSDPEPETGEGAGAAAHVSEAAAQPAAQAAAQPASSDAVSGGSQAKKRARHVRKVDDAFS
jgi:hypothetical protein